MPACENGGYKTCCMPGAMTETTFLAAEPALTALPRACLLRQYISVRAHSLKLAAPLSAEDQCVQSMPDASPVKWHLAHATWFFETLLLGPYLPGYRPFDKRYAYLFNSYYETLGPRHPRAQRGLLTRPALEEIHAYRRHVDSAMQRLIEHCGTRLWPEIRPLILLGLNHEQQHQELLLTDILHVLWCNPFRPAYAKDENIDGLQPASIHAAAEPAWLRLPGGIVRIGSDGHAPDTFVFDNETPRHDVLLSPYQLADRLVNCGDYAQFIADGGYRRAGLWLSDGWAAVQAQGWQAPMYWVKPDNAGMDAGECQVFGLGGLRRLDPGAPVTNLSFYEASAYAEWAGARLPTEFEWEAAADDPRLLQASGHAWQWTRSSYDPYPGFRSWAGAAGEYNGKFMVGQLVLRGGSFATPAGHARTTYRNFFPPNARWQFSGLRLAKDLQC